MVEELDSMLLDVETAFLYGEIEEEIYMEVPVEMREVFSGPDDEEQRNTYYQLQKGIYGLCRSAKQFWKTLVIEMTNPDINFKISPADPCLLYREDELEICMIIIYVDDMLVIGHKKSIQDLQEKVGKLFSIKIEKNLADYLGCEFHLNQDKTKGWLGQTSIIRSLKKVWS